MNKIFCARCVYDESISDIVFDNEGICNYCKLTDEMEKEYPVGEEGVKKLDLLAKKIKKSGYRKKYDCVVGVSGGCDSSFLLYKMKELGLRPLAVHFDNTWNSTIATENINNMLEKLEVDLFTIVVDNQEYNDIYRSFLKSGVIDIDCPTDIGLATTLYKAAEKFGVKYIIEGHSFRTEGVSPLGWLYMDGKYIESVAKEYGNVTLKTFPNLWLHKFLKWIIINRIKKIRPLYYIDYKKEDVKQMLQQEFGWKWYGGHHLENRFTAFCHSYYFPKRYNIDQRANGYAALVRSGQMNREDALNLLKTPPFLETDIVELVKKRLGYNDEEFNLIITQPKKTYKDFKTYKQTFEKYKWFFWIMYKLDLVSKSFYVKYTSKHK